jgi:hypothetical protein
MRSGGLLGWALGRRRGRDLRPARTERHAALESVRDQLRRQGADERRRMVVQHAALPLALLAFAAGIAASEPLFGRAATARPDVFALRRLAVAGAVRLSASEVSATLGLAGPALAAATPESVAARLVEHPWIAQARAARVSPDTIAVRIVERVPAAIWLRAHGEPLLVDDDGTPFAPAAGAEDLPRLYAAGAATPHAPDRRLAEGVSIVRAVEDAGFVRPTVELDGGDPRLLPALRLDGLPARVVLGSGELGGKLEALARLLAALPDGHGAAEIDLRFARQVVLRPAPPPEMPAGDADRSEGPAPAGPNEGPSAAHGGGRAREPGAAG